MLISSVVGARPNFMKIAPVVLELKRRGIPQRLVHTGQHYDAAMSRVFFEDLGMPEPDVYLGVGSGTHAQQTARVMVAIEEECLCHRPDVLVVGGDVNSTVAAAMAAAKLGIPVAHVEAGLRSFDREMPEELNRIVTDHLSQFLLTSEASGNANLAHEGIPPASIHFVGNCMVDSLRKHYDRALAGRPWEAYGLELISYALMTLHRPFNVDSDVRLRELIGLAGRIAQRIPVIFPVHPRTRRRLDDLGQSLPASVLLVDPQPYIPFLGLMAGSKLVLTDSGGIQEETTALRVPCLTLRPNTERPSTVDLGTNAIVGDDLDLADRMVGQILRGEWKEGSVPPLWDGHAASRVADVLLSGRACHRQTVATC
jgi:UDP-N-acetylglucosamine 2-epimerase (non-hydrolysing)